MITTFCFIQFIAFYLWQVTSPRYKSVAMTGLTAAATGHTTLSRLTGTVLWLGACTGFIVQWGVGAGCCGFITGLMAVGGLSVMLEPFQYLRVPGITAIYICCVILEIFV
ncbi:hypothetical protein [Arsenicibacter rosenii]|uniref:Uncharacterized protein n=1 Tax=Arsenicibacter rosenii TaxID=1750698 RepID=A0A1S2VR46_9BACT|nr:hypothetical protein [Arsenicibacter rosenii]OIN60685.1 hypothetical protein BLX24_00800 [Arsenicibacter rosenii]